MVLEMCYCPGACASGKEEGAAKTAAEGGKTREGGKAGAAASQRRHEEAERRRAPAGAEDASTPAGGAGEERESATTIIGPLKRVEIQEEEALKSIRFRWRGNRSEEALKENEAKLLELKSKLTPSERREIETNGMCNAESNIYRTLQRYLIARGCDVAKAYEQIKGTLAFRTSDEFSRQALLRDAPAWDKFEHIFKHMPHGFHGTDVTHGTVVYVDNVGRLDSDALINGYVTERDIMVCHLLLLEYELGVLAEEATRKWRVENPEEPRIVLDDVTNVIDMEGLQPMKLLSGKGMSFFRKVAVHDQAQYPETLRVAYVVNAPRVFAYVWSIIKYLLDSDVRKKVFVTPPGPATEKVLLENVFGSVEQMPRRFGGTYDGIVLCGQKDAPLTGPTHERFMRWVRSEKLRLLGEEIPPPPTASGSRDDATLDSAKPSDTAESLSLEERVSILEKKTQSTKHTQTMGRRARNNPLVLCAALAVALAFAVGADARVLQADSAVQELKTQTELEPAAVLELPSEQDGQDDKKAECAKERKELAEKCKARFEELKEAVENGKISLPEFKADFAKVKEGCKLRREALHAKCAVHPKPKPEPKDECHTIAEACRKKLVEHQCPKPPHPGFTPPLEEDSTDEPPADEHDEESEDKRPGLCREIVEGCAKAFHKAGCKPPHPPRPSGKCMKKAEELRAGCAKKLKALKAKLDAGDITKAQFAKYAKEVRAGCEVAAKKLKKWCKHSADVPFGRHHGHHGEHKHDEEAVAMAGLEKAVEFMNDIADEAPELAGVDKDAEEEEATEADVDEEEADVDEEEADAEEEEADVDEEEADAEEEEADAEEEEADVEADVEEDDEEEADADSVEDDEDDEEEMAEATDDETNEAFGLDDDEHEDDDEEARETAEDADDEDADAVDEDVEELGEDGEDGEEEEADNNDEADVDDNEATEEAAEEAAEAAETYAEEAAEAASEEVGETYGNEASQEDDSSEEPTEADAKEKAKEEMQA